MKIYISVSGLEQTDGRVSETKIGHTKVSYNYDGSRIKIFSIRTKTSELGKGYAKQALSFMLNEADKLRIPIYLDSSPLNKQTNGQRLLKFYESFGFKPTGKKINAVGDLEMKREPK